MNHIGTPAGHETGLAGPLCNRGVCDGVCVCMSTETSF